MKRNLITAVLIILLTSLLISCSGGGGGGGSGSSSDQQTTTPLKTSTLKIMQSGDSWSYNISGTEVDGLSSSPSATINFTGTISSAITSSVVTTLSIACKVQEDHTIITANSITLVDSHDFTYFTQDSTGVYKYGEYSPGYDIHWISTPPYNRLEIGSPVSVGATASSIITYSNGVTETRSYTVAAKEYVSIGKTDYESYKIVSTLTTTYNGATYESSTKNITSWLVPGLGYIKHHWAEYDYLSGHVLDSIVDYTATLTSTNVSYSSDTGGVSVDNSKVVGTFTVTSLKSSTTYSTDIGTMTFDGAGHGTYASLVSPDTGTFNYTLTVPGNDLTIDGTLIGTLNTAGNFFTAVDVSSSVSGTSIMLVSGVKNGSAITDNTAITYVGGSFAGGITPSTLDLLSVAFHTPSASVLTYTSLTSGGTGTLDYILASNGTFTVDPGGIKPVHGAVSDDKSIIIFTDNSGVACNLQLPGSGMNNAKLNGTYKAYRFVDSNVSGPSAFSTGRTTWTFDGNGNGAYQVTADSGGALGQGTMTYTMSADGTFVLGSMTGISLADGSVIVFFDDETFNLNNIIRTVIAIKQ